MVAAPADRFEGQPPDPSTELARRIAALRDDLVIAGVLNPREASQDGTGWDLVMGEEPLALDEVLACVWPPEAMPPDAYATAVGIVREWELEDARAGREPDGETAEDYVDRLLHRRPMQR